MDNIFSLFSQLFFIVSVVVMFWGIYIIRSNSRSRVNQVFLLVCLSLAVWAFGFSMANSATSLDYALLWRRFSSMGMTFLFGAILHFIILLTKGNSALKHAWQLILIYLPSLIAMYLFTFSPSATQTLYDLIQTDLGLINVAEHSIWNYFYYAYYLLYMVLSLALIWKWRDRITNRENLRQANMIFRTILLTAVFGSLTDVLSSVFLTKPIPQVAPLFILLPVWAMYYSLKHYDLINYDKRAKEDIITDSERQKTLYIMAYVFLIGGIVSFFLEYGLSLKYPAHNLKLGIFKSVTVFLTGLILFFIQKIRHPRAKAILTHVMLVASIPLMTIGFIDTFAITIWAYPIILIMTALILNNRTLLISTTVTSILTQRAIWRFNSEGTVYIDEYDYIFRMVFIFTAFLVGYYVNKIYTSKMAENKYQLQFQKLTSEILSDFITINQNNKEEKIAILLEKLGEFFGADRTYLFFIDHESGEIRRSQAWRLNTDYEDAHVFDTGQVSTYSWWFDQLQQDKLIHIRDVELLPPEAESVKQQLMQQGVKTALAVSVEDKTRMKGFIGIDTVEDYKNWTTQDLELLTIMSNLLSDALMRVSSEQEIEQMAYFDQLTYLPNRTFFEKRINQSIKKSNETGHVFSIIFIDLDNFKLINDRLGHYGGDILLRTISDRLLDKARTGDMVGRFGGDEFLILIEDIEDKDILSDIAENIMSVFDEPFTLSGEDYYMTGSAGIATYPEDGETSEALIQNADTAMYQAKEQGKNQYVFCTEALKEDVEKNARLSTELLTVLDRDELEVHYQPQINLETSEISGFEALLRWNHPEFGMIPPPAFIPLAEKNGMINDIGEWVMKTACAQSVAWKEKGYSTGIMAVNLSGTQLLNIDLAERVEAVLQETGLDPQDLELEITENIALNESEDLDHIFEQLEAIGVSIAIDDFGKEYSSLSRLKRITAHRIKIDMEFIHGMEHNPKDKAITLTIINLAESLEAGVVAEGVETLSQAKYLQSKGCETAQGYYYYRPMTVDELEVELAKRQTSPQNKSL